jgi:hypothetical protein
MDSLLGCFRNGTGIAELCTKSKAGTPTTLVPQASGGGSPTIPPGAGGVSTATEVAADQSKVGGMDLGQTGVVGVIVGVVVISVLLVVASFFYWNKHYNKKSPPLRR